MANFEFDPTETVGPIFGIDDNEPPLVDCTTADTGKVEGASCLASSYMVDPGFDKKKNIAKGDCTMCTHVVYCNRCGCPVVSRQSQNPPNEWTPGMLPRALIFSLGYIVGDAMHAAPTGFEMMTFIFTIILANEFIYACLRHIAPRPTIGSPKSIVGRVGRMMVLIRYFSITAAASSINRMLKRTFSNGADVVSVILPLVIIFVVANILEETGL
jgi:hypothetical protein